MNTKIRTVKPKELIKALERNGFYIHHITGSHYFLKKYDIKYPICIPFHNKDLKM